MTSRPSAWVLVLIAALLILTVGLFAGGCRTRSQADGEAPGRVHPGDGAGGEYPLGGTETPAAAWSELATALPPPGYDRGFLPYHEGLGKALALAYASDSHVVVEHEKPFPLEEGPPAYRYDWYHFAAPYAGGQPWGWDARGTACFIFTRAENGSPYLALAIETRETVALEVDPAVGDGPALEAATREAISLVRREVLDAYLPLEEEFWEVFATIDWRPGAERPVLPGRDGTSLSLECSYPIQTGPGYSYIIYILKVISSQGDSSGP